MENKNLVIVLLLIIIVVLAASIVYVLMPSTSAQNGSKITITSNKTLYEGDNFTLKLTDINGTPIANQNVNITIVDEDGSKNFKSVVTDSNGLGVLKIDRSAGKYTINCTYEGNENYTGNHTTQKLTVEEVIEEPVVTQQEVASYDESSSSSQNDNRPAVDSGGITREEADYWGWEYTTEHGGHYIGINDHWDENAGMYHD